MGPPSFMRSVVDRNVVMRCIPVLVILRTEVLQLRNETLLYYNLMGPPSYMRSVVDRNVVVRHIPVLVILRTEVLQLQNAGGWGAGVGISAVGGRQNT